MKFCQNHWDKLRAAIEAQGLDSMVPKSGEEACNRMVKQLQGNEVLNNYDPLMAAHNAILSNAMDTLRYIGGNPFFMMAEHRDHPEWECPICYLNWLSEEHDRTCIEPDCKKPRGLKFDDWVEKAAQGQREYVDSRIGGRS